MTIDGKSKSQLFSMKWMKNKKYQQQQQLWQLYCSYIETGDEFDMYPAH